jgi:hypothetical protein
VLSCGTCGPGEVCGGGGVENVCGAVATCKPATCQAAGKTCGTIPDGCGGTLTCGTCKEGETCGVTAPNVCAATPQEKEVRWAVQMGGLDTESVVGSGMDGQNRSYVLVTSASSSSTGGGGTLRLTRIDPDGTISLAKEWTFSGYPMFQVAVTPLGNVLVSFGSWCTWCEPQSIDFGAGTIEEPTLVKLSPEARVVWQRPVGGHPVRALAADGGGGAIVLTEEQRVARFASDGTQRWSLLKTADTCTADRDGNAVCTTSIWGQPPFVNVEKLAAKDGSRLWIREVKGLAWPTSVVSTDGLDTVVVGQRQGPLEAGDVTVTEGATALLLLGADGVPRWGRGIEWLYSPRAATSSSRIALAGSQLGCGSLAVYTFDAGGEPRWIRQLPSDGQCGTGIGIGGLQCASDGTVTVAGSFWGTVLLGDERLRPQGGDAFVVRLSP